MAAETGIIKMKDAIRRPPSFVIIILYIFSFIRQAQVHHPALARLPCAAHDIATHSPHGSLTAQLT